MAMENVAAPTAPRKKAKARAQTVLRQIRVRPRLATATLVGICVALALPQSFSGPTRAIVAWDAGVGLYLVFAAFLMFHSSFEHMRLHACQQDDGAGVVLASTVGAAVASLAAIVLELVRVKSYTPREQTVHLILAGATVFASWCFVHTSFALHYAHEYYIDRRADGQKCLEFPGGGPPDYLDFLYFSFIIGTTSQTADVSIVSRPLRRLALLHGIIAFLFNTTVVALSVNIAAGLI